MQLFEPGIHKANQKNDFGPSWGAGSKSGKGKGSKGEPSSHEVKGAKSKALKGGKHGKKK